MSIPELKVCPQDRQKFLNLQAQTDSIFLNIKTTTFEAMKTEEGTEYILVRMNRQGKVYNDSSYNDSSYNDPFNYYYVSIQSVVEYLFYICYSSPILFNKYESEESFSAEFNSVIYQELERCGIVATLPESFTLSKVSFGEGRKLTHSPTTIQIPEGMRQPRPVGSVSKVYELRYDCFELMLLTIAQRIVRRYGDRQTIFNDTKSLSTWVRTLLLSGIPIFVIQSGTVVHHDYLQIMYMAIEQLGITKKIKRCCHRELACRQNFKDLFARTRTVVCGSNSPNISGIIEDIQTGASYLVVKANKGQRFYSFLSMTYGGGTSNGSDYAVLDLSSLIDRLFAIIRNLNLRMATELGADIYTENTVKEDIRRFLAELGFVYGQNSPGHLYEMSFNDVKTLLSEVLIQVSNLEKYYDPNSPLNESVDYFIFETFFVSAGMFHVPMIDTKNYNTNTLDEYRQFKPLFRDVDIVQVDL